MAFIGLSRPRSQTMSALVVVGQTAPQSSALAASERLRVVAFIRHVGCPFAENTVKQLRLWAEQHPHVAVFLVSHGNASQSTEWINTLGGLGRLRLVIDTQRELHAKWGVGFSNLWHFAGPSSLLGVAALLFKASETETQQAPDGNERRFFCLMANASSGRMYHARHKNSSYRLRISYLRVHIRNKSRQLVAVHPFKNLVVF